MQKNAYEDLENALNGGESPDKLKQSQLSGGSGKNRGFSPMKSNGSEQKGGRP